MRRSESRKRSKPAKEELLTSSHEEANELCRLAQQIGNLAPWEWMEETDVFGVQDAMAAEQGLAAMNADVANRLARLLLEAQLLPKRLMIRSDRLLELLTPLARELNVELFYADELPAIEEAANFMFEQMADGR